MNKFLTHKVNNLTASATLAMAAKAREMKSKGCIPSAAIRRYEIACEKRIALAEVNDIWEKHEKSSYKVST